MPRYAVTIVQVSYAYAVQEIVAEDGDAAERGAAELLRRGDLDLEFLTDDVEQRVLYSEPAPEPPSR